MAPDSATKMSDCNAPKQTVSRPYRTVLVFCFSANRSNPNSINRSINSPYPTPLASHNFGYMLIGVKPGIVLISLI